MSDDDDNANITPLSSSSSGPSGTRAWSVAVAGNEKPDENTSAAPEQSESSVAPMPDNDHTDAATEKDKRPVAETEAETQATPQSLADDPEPSTEGQPADYDEEATPAFEAAPIDESSTAEPIETETDTETADEANTFSDTATAFEEALTDNGTTGSTEEPAVEDQATEELRQAVFDTMVQQENRPEEAFALFERISEDFSVMLATARNDAAAFSLKLMEFAQANAQNNFELARAYSSARSLPEIFNLQADYVKRQLELLNAQARELQALTSQITAKNAMDAHSRRSAG